MICKYVKIGEKFNLIVDHRGSTDIIIYWLKIGVDTEYSITPGKQTIVDDNVLVKEITFPDIGEYIIKVFTDGNIAYERITVYTFDAVENNTLLYDNLMLLQNIIANNNDSTNDILRQLKIINARI